jgi:transposase
VKRIRERVAGLDVHRDTVVACCQVKQPDRSIEVTKQSFATTAKGLGELAAWLSDAGVDTVAMEATGVYWKPVYYCLEGLFDELWLCNAQHVKNVPGRKTDLSDAEWLADVAAHGMVRPSFVPPPEIRELRDVTRYRKTQVEARAKEIQRLEKTLQDAGIKLSSVASKVWTKSSREMIEAMIEGERDPKVLAQMAKSRLRAKIPQLEEAFSGRFGSHHALVCRQVIEHIDFLDRSIATLTADVTDRLCPFESAVTILCSIPGVSRTTAEVMIAEMGVDMTRFPTSGHLCAWAGVAPASHESAGKRQPVGTSPRLNLAAARSRRSSQGGVAHQGHLPLRPVLQAGPTKRFQQGHHRRCPLHFGRLLAPAHQRCPLRRPWRPILRASTRSRRGGEAASAQDRGSRLRRQDHPSCCIALHQGSIEAQTDRHLVRARPSTRRN